MNILFACGGSGGHINPALAMAEMIQKKHPQDIICFAGRKKSMESDAASKMGYPFFEISIEGLRRKISCQALKSIFKAFRAPSQAKKILLSAKTDLVIATGGYVSYPFIKAAHALKIPSILFEANAIPGLAFRLCEGKTNKILLQFEECLKELRHPEKAKIIGAPLRSGFSEISRPRARALLGLPANAFIFLSFGGSLGAAQINKTCTEVMPFLEKHHVLHIHACGKRYFEEMKQKNNAFVRKKQLLPYIDQMPLYMAAANIILCRAGAMTLAELSHVGRAAIVVPSPNVTGNHQSKNAHAYAQKNAVQILEESEISAESLLQKVLELKEAPQKIFRLEKNIKVFDTPHTALLVEDAVNAFRPSQKTLI